MRSKIKAMSYGLAYGLSAFGLSRQLGISTGEAKTLMDEYFLRFGEVRDYLHRLVDDARHTGYTATMLGRRRYLPDLSNHNGDAESGKAPGRRVVSQIRAADPEAQVDQYLGDAAHSRTADTDEMDVFDFMLHWLSS